MSRAYTFSENAQLDAFLDGVLREIGEEAAGGEASQYLDYLVLGGGYGRGEGGTLETPEGPKLYNDLDFFVISKSDDPAEAKALDTMFAKIAKKWTVKLGIDVDFGGAKSVRYISERRQMLMWREMIQCANIVYGDEKKFAEALKADRPVPAREAAKLALNRVSGLLFAKKRLENDALSPEDVDFISRNINKAALACADIVLLNEGDMPFKTLERLEKIHAMELPEKISKLKNAYARAAEFKKFPHLDTPRSQLGAWHTETRKLFENIAEQYAAYLKSYKNGGLKTRLRDAKVFISMRKDFKVLGAGPSAICNPAFALIQAAMCLLKSKESIPQNAFDSYLRIWRAIN